MTDNCFKIPYSTFCYTTSPSRTQPTSTCLHLYPAWLWTGSHSLLRDVGGEIDGLGGRFDSGHDSAWLRRQLLPSWNVWPVYLQVPKVVGSKWWGPGVLAFHSPSAPAGLLWFSLWAMHLVILSICFSVHPIDNYSSRHSYGFKHMVFLHLKFTFIFLPFFMLSVQFHGYFRMKYLKYYLSPPMMTREVCKLKSYIIAS